MRIKDLFVTIFILIPVLSLAQEKQNSTSFIDSMVNELPKIPDTKDSKGVLLGNIGMAYSEQNNYPKAIEYYFKALKIFENLGNENGIARITGNIGSIYLSLTSDTTGVQETDTANLHKAIDYLSRSISLSKEYGYPDVINTFYKDLAEALRIKNYNEAVATKQNNKQAISDESNVKMANIGTRKDEDVKNKQSTDKNKEGWYYIAGITVAAIILLIILIIVFFSMFRTYNRQKASTKTISEEKKKSEDLLLNILPEQVALELKEKGMVHPQQFNNVTVIMTDFAGFTTVAERFSPKQLVGELHACFKAFDGMLEKYNIEKIKTVGDAYLAVAGLPVTDPNHAIHAISLAIKMREFMLYRKTQLGDATFDMRIGVHTGSVVAGIVGMKKFAYDIWGDTVNLAARMEQNCEPGKINISQSTYDLVKDKFHCDYRGEIVAKNKGKLNMYYVLDTLV